MLKITLIKSITTVDTVKKDVEPNTMENTAYKTKKQIPDINPLTSPAFLSRITEIRPDIKADTAKTIYAAVSIKESEKDVTVKIKAKIKDKITEHKAPQKEPDKKPISLSVTEYMSRCFFIKTSINQTVRYV